MAFATADDVATRLGRALTAAEIALSEYVIASVTGQIVTIAGRDAAWATALTDVPPIVKALCVEKAIAVGSNPSGLQAHSEQLGQASENKTFRRRDLPEILLTPEEELLVTEALYGSGGSVPVESAVDALIEYAETGVIDP